MEKMVYGISIKMYGFIFFAALVLGFPSMSQATLITIGTASFSGGGSYNLIYDADGLHGPVTWLDLTSAPTGGQAQSIWASGLGSQLTVSLNHGFSSSDIWSTGWRLPETALVDGTLTSELHHLVFDELGNPLNTHVAQTGDFTHLITTDLAFYWIARAGNQYLIDKRLNLNDPMYNGGSFEYTDQGGLGYAMALHSGTVTSDAVPEPSTLLLLGSGLVGIAGFGRKRLVKKA